MRKQRVVLEHHTDFAFVRRRADDFVVAETQTAGIRSRETRQAPSAAWSCPNRKDRARSKIRRFLHPDRHGQAHTRHHRFLVAARMRIGNALIGFIGVGEVGGYAGRRLRSASKATSSARRLAFTASRVRRRQCRLFGNHVLIHLRRDFLPFGIPLLADRQQAWHIVRVRRQAACQRIVNLPGVIYLGVGRSISDVFRQVHLKLGACSSRR